MPRPALFQEPDRRLLNAIRGKLALALHHAVAYERSEGLAAIDGLTAVPNSRSLFLRLDAELARCRRNHSTLAVLVCDVSAFPPAGYPAIAAALRRICREDDCVARIGDGFAMVLSDFRQRDLEEKRKLIASAVQQVMGGDRAGRILGRSGFLSGRRAHHG